jgi:tRNA/rRNA methyltransferase
VFAYELRQAAKGEGVPAGRKSPLASHEEIERLYAHLERTLFEHGYLDPRHPKKLMPRLRRLFNRAQLEKEEVSLLRGVIKALATPRAKRSR